jgi:glycosyltransferase involved in cell wall biosynthesis
MSSPKVSIIMPIYNASKFLRQSLESLLNQTLEDIEIICVNDGSTDDSLSIMNEYASNDKRIKIIDKLNGGYGHSVNKGIQHSTGEYIGILEPDDYVESTMYKDLYQLAIDNQVDVVKSNYYEYKRNDDSSVIYESLHDLPYGKVFAASEYSSIFYVRPSVWSAIYKKSYLEENHICFNETPGASYQDTGFAFKVWASANRIYLTKNAYIHYAIDNDNSSVKSAGKIFSVCDEMHSIESYLNEDAEMKNSFSKYLQSVKLDTYYWNLCRISDEYKDYFKDVIGFEFLKAEYDGFLDKEVLGKERWKILEPILESYRNRSELNDLKEGYNEIIHSNSYKVGSIIMKIPSKIKSLMKR